MEHAQGPQHLSQGGVTFAYSEWRSEIQSRDWRFFSFSNKGVCLLPPDKQ